MAHANTRRPASNRTDLYQQITGRIIADLESGRVPWVQPWGSANAGVGMPYNAVSGRRYSGVNILTLWDAVISRGFATHGFLTFRQAVTLGGAVRKGERGTGVIYTQRFIPRELRRQAGIEGREPTGGIPFLKWFTVFSAEQCDGLPAHFYEPPSPIPDGLILPEAESLIKATGADFRIGGSSAFYSPTHDYVQVPRPEDFFEPINWHRTAFHELSHWAGGASRLNRDQTGAFGSIAYGKEELIAEMAGAFVCAALGITPTVRHADYLGSWLEIIRADNRAILRAASAASKAADYLLAFRPRSIPAANDDNPDPDPDGAMALDGRVAA